jgi:uncharacterized membrane protein SirB2
MLRTRNQFLPFALSLMSGVLLYTVAVFLIFRLEPVWVGPDPFTIIMFISVGGLGALVSGYVSVMIFGGMISLNLIEFIASITKSRHVIEVISDESKKTAHKVTQSFMFYLPALIFIISIALAWDIHNLHDPRTWIFHDVLHVLDVFTKPVDMNAVAYFVYIIPAMVVLVAIAGIVPAMVLPYFRRFKVTGVNSGPFHTEVLFTVVEFVAGLGTLLTLVGQIYQVLWVGKDPTYYQYILPVMLGLSLHYVAGTFLARDKSENMVMTKLEASSRKRVVRGTVDIQVPAGNYRKSS